MPVNSLDLFNPLTAHWFKNTLGTPTAVQEEAWPAIAEGNHTLVSAPTGTGKTLSAFLVFIDRLKEQAREGTLKQELQLIYVSPLKSLAGDIRENLRRPLDGISEEEYNAGIYSENADTTGKINNSAKLNNTSNDLGAVIRTADIPQGGCTGKRYPINSIHPDVNDDMPKGRYIKQLLRPNIDVAIRTGDTPQNERRKMIKKPPHILITTPESLYLMLTSKTGQSILHTAHAIIIDELHAIIDSKRGAHLMLSIARLDKLCQKPLQRIGLSATIEPLSKAAEYLSPDPVTIVAPKMHKEIRLEVTSPLPYSRAKKKDNIWQEIAGTVYEYCKGTRSVIAFVEGRAYAEKLAYFVNQLGGAGFARTHHGSLSKEQRFEVEDALRNGELRLLCATSSMELGIDVGDIDQVLQIGCPRSISGTMQRLGRAGHNPNRVSVMHIFPRASAESLYCGLTAEVARNGGIEYSHPPKLCFDVLAQHLVSMALGDGYDLDEVMEILPRAYPFREVTKEEVRDILCMLAGDYEHERNIPVRPRVLYDRIHDRVDGDPYSRMLAISAGGTIPDRGMYAVKAENGTKLGEVEEEFVFESHEGDRFLLGTFAWKILSIQKDSIIVTQTNSYGARLPFWKGDIRGRALKTGFAFGAILRRLNNAAETDSLYKEIRMLGLDETAAQGAQDFIKRQIALAGCLPDDNTILIEHFRDETGNRQMMVHSVFGRQVNSPLSLLIQAAARQQMGTNISCVEDDDGFLLFPYGGHDLPEGLLLNIDPNTIRPVLEALLPATPLFNLNFRYNTARALMTGVRKHGRQPLWVQRLRSAELLDSLMKYKNHPLIRETKRECMEDYWDLSGVELILNRIRSGDILVREIYSDTPSPMSFQLRQQTEAAMMYDYTPTPPGIYRQTEEALEQANMIIPAKEQLERMSQRVQLPEDEKQLHSLLMIEGDLTAGELEVPIDWLEKLARQGQAEYIEPGLWIAAEQEEKYTAALVNADIEARQQIVLRLLRYRGAFTLDQLCERYFWTEGEVQEIIKVLCSQGSVVENDGIYYHTEIYNRARRETLKSRRSQIKTLPAQCYAALLAGRIRSNAPAGEQLEAALKGLCNMAFPPELWEGVILPARVGKYRPELLDTLLAQGNIFWSFNSDKELSFHLYEDIDWDADISIVEDSLEGDEKIIFDTLLKRGASFMQRLSGLLNSASPYDTLMVLTEKGLVCADSFMPVRQWINGDKLNKSTLRQRVSARVKAMTTGRWELSRPPVKQTVEKQLDQLFDRVVILSRETVQDLPWATALETLRVWEYTGRVRRGYFIEGLSGIQFIREKDYSGTMYTLEHPKDEIIWLPAVDIAQPWGKCLPHMQGKEFLNVPGTVTALRAGVPVAVFERQGKVLRVFDDTALPDALKAFSEEYAKRRIFPALNRILVKQYPKEAADALAAAGFSHEIQDYVLYRSYQ